MTIYARYREHAGQITKAELARQLDVTQMAVQYYEEGRRHPTRAIAWRFLRLARSRGFHVELEDIYPEPEKSV